MSFELLGRIVGLMARSPRHREYSVADIERLILPPLRLGQCAVIRDGDRVTGWGSYALFTKSAENGFISGQRRIRTSDWGAGDRLWLMDVIAPHGTPERVTREMRKMLKGQGYGGETIRFRRTKGDQRRYSQVRV